MDPDLAEWTINITHVGTLYLGFFSQVQNHCKKHVSPFLLTAWCSQIQVVKHIWLENNSFVSEYDTRNCQKVFQGNLFHGFS